MPLNDTMVRGLLKKETKSEEESAAKLEDLHERLAAEKGEVVEEKTEVTTEEVATPSDNEATEVVTHEEEELLIGPNSDKWQLMSILVDGKSKKNVLDKNGNPKGIVGYKIKALEEGLTYMHSKITPTLLSNPFAIPDSEEKTAQKDEVILFTKAEAGRLLADVSTEGTITGGGVVAILALGKPIAQANEGDENATELPFRPYLKGTKTSGKLAEQVPVEAIIDVKAVQDPNNPRKSNKVQNINKGFERFKPVLEETSKQAERRKAKADATKVASLADDKAANATATTAIPNATEAESTLNTAQAVANSTNAAQVVQDSADKATASQTTTGVNDKASDGSTVANADSAKQTGTDSKAEGKAGSVDVTRATNSASKTVTTKTTTTAKGQTTSTRSKAATAAARKRNATRRSHAELYRKAFDSKRS